MTKTIAYLRVSTDKQADHGVSLEAQRAKVEAYAALYDLELVEVIVDAGASAKTLDRPGLTKALGALKSGKAEALLVVKLDRLTRSVRDLGALLEGVFQKAALLSVGEQIDTRTAAGRLVLNVLGSVSQWEREAIGERTSAAMSHMASEGRYTGGHVRYGYTLGANGALVPHEGEQRVVKTVRSMRSEGLSFGAIAKRLNEQGYVARTGRAFGPKQVWMMVEA
jgi:site-specific DNA recombinase